MFVAMSTLGVSTYKNYPWHYAQEFNFFKIYRISILFNLTYKLSFPDIRMKLPTFKPEFHRNWSLVACNTWKWLEDDCIQTYMKGAPSGDQISWRWSSIKDVLSGNDWKYSSSSTSVPSSSNTTYTAVFSSYPSLSIDFSIRSFKLLATIPFLNCLILSVILKGLFTSLIMTLKNQH